MLNNYTNVAISMLHLCFIYALNMEHKASKVPRSTLNRVVYLSAFGKKTFLIREKHPFKDLGF
ncbi:MAG: hypothetical protein K0S23_3155 [Fluviicola sp.]|jgi:hypothetical protein|nr:hypothetical protein [Fluviicola sp.]